MEVTGLFHVAIKTNDLDATVKFYTDVLGMKLVHRPDFGFPGAWIAAGDSAPLLGRASPVRPSMPATGCVDHHCSNATSKSPRRRGLPLSSTANSRSPSAVDSSSLSGGAGTPKA